MRNRIVTLSISAFLLTAVLNVSSTSAQTRFTRVNDIDPKVYEVFQVQLSEEDHKKAQENPEAFFRELITANKIQIRVLLMDTRIRAGRQFSRETTIWHCKAPQSCVSETMVIEHLK
jgi:hypothetical protein